MKQQKEFLQILEDLKKKKNSPSIQCKEPIKLCEQDNNQAISARQENSDLLLSSLQENIIKSKIQSFNRRKM